MQVMLKPEFRYLYLRFGRDIVVPRLEAAMAVMDITYLYRIRVFVKQPEEWEEEELSIGEKLQAVGSRLTALEAETECSAELETAAGQVSVTHTMSHR